MWRFEGDYISQIYFLINLSLNPTHLLKPTHMNIPYSQEWPMWRSWMTLRICVFTEVLFMFKSTYPLNLAFFPFLAIFSEAYCWCFFSSSESVESKKVSKCFLKSFDCLRSMQSFLGVSVCVYLCLSLSTISGNWQHRDKIKRWTDELCQNTKGKQNKQCYFSNGIRTVYSKQFIELQVWNSCSGIHLRQEECARE